MLQRNVSLELAAETHFYFKWLLERSLKGQILTDAARDHLGTEWATDFERWEGTFSRHFLDMTTMIRLGSAVETSLRDCFMRGTGEDLAQDPRLQKYKQMDLLWFDPLDRLTENISDLRDFVCALS